MTRRGRAGQCVTRRTLALSLLIAGIACLVPPRGGWTATPSNNFDRYLQTGQALFQQGKLEFYLGAPRAFGGGIDKAEAQVNAIAKLDSAMGQRARALIEEKIKTERGSAADTEG